MKLLIKNSLGALIGFSLGVSLAVATDALLLHGNVDIVRAVFEVLCLWIGYSWCLLDHKKEITE